MKRNPLDYFILVLKGLAMGAANVVPGVSGGTIAFISGIYEELIDAIKMISVSGPRDLLRGRVGEFWRNIHGNFLVALGLGIGVSLVSLAKLMLFLLDQHPIAVWSFFIGLVVASAILVLVRIKRWSVGVGVALAMGGVIAWYCAVATPAETPTAAWFVFLAGAIAICTMILPGVSGSFVLVLMGKYEYILGAVKDFNLVVIAVFGLGCVTGLLGFAHFLGWMLKRFHDATVALLAGFLIGSLWKIWPWKETLETIVNRRGEIVPVVQRNLLPQNFAEATGGDPHLGVALALAAVGVVLVLALERLGSARGAGHGAE